MMRKIKSVGVLIALTFSIAAWGQTKPDTTEVVNEVDLDEVVVSSSRTPRLFSQTGRVVSVISRDQIKNAPVQSIAELLEYSLNVDVRQRGNHGVQADLSIRGGSFDQVLILLNGVNITDPQTGHHNLNLPVDLESIERIEILEGPGSRVWGPNAFSGAINVITGSRDENHLGLQTMGGEHGLYRVGVQGTINTGVLKNYVSASLQSSDGYIDNTDFKASYLFYQGHVEADFGSLEFQAGYNDKGFGANSFYTPAYPNQYEATNTTFLSAKATTGEKLKFTPILYYRRHQDRFELFRDNPADWYTGHNHHLTDVYGSNLNATYSSNLGETSFGAEFRSENILSNVLGEPMDKPVKVPGEDAEFTNHHSRTNISYFLEHTVEVGKMALSAGLMANWNSDLDRSLNYYPGFDVSYSLPANLRVFASINKSLRMPTFTDLYFEGPTNIGNPDLKPEEATTHELGLKYAIPYLKGQVTAFNRHGKNIIDWVKENPEDKWQAQNLTELHTWGLETSWTLQFGGLINPEFPIQNIHISYSWLDMDKNSNNLISKYALDYLKHKFSASLQHKIISSLSAMWQVSYQDRNGTYTLWEDDHYAKEVPYDPFWLLDLRLTWQKSWWSLYGEASNILNKEYNDLGNVPQPGSWFRLGAKFNLDF